MHRKILICILFVTIFNLISANLTPCETSQKHFADMCFSPKPSLEVDFEWLLSNQPAEGWYSDIGNDVAQYHYSEIIKQEALSRTDDFSELCMRTGFDHATGDGKVSGFNGMSSTWICNNSMDFPGSQRCDLQIDHSKYHEDVLAYISYHDKTTKFAIFVNCFPNGQVGWLTLSKNSKLTEDERKNAVTHAEKLGFPKDTNEILFGDKCPQ